MEKNSKHAESSKIKMSEAHMGKPLSEEHRLALIGSHEGYHHSEEVKRRIGLANAIPVDTGLLRKLYVDQKLTIRQVASRMGVSAPTIHRNLVLLDFVRSVSEARRLSKPPQEIFYRERKMPGHPRANKRGYVKEHILRWEEASGRLLPMGWVIHHLNGIKIDNRPENLEAMPSGNHCSGLVNEALRKRVVALEDKIQQLENTNYVNADNKNI